MPSPPGADQAPDLSPREAWEILRAIQSGGADALVNQSPGGPQVRLLEGTDEPYRLLVDAMGEGALVLDRAGVVVFANPALGRLTGKQSEALVGYRLGKHLSAADARALDEVLPGFMETGGTLDVGLGRGAARVPVHISARPIGVGGFSGAILVATDISEARRLTGQVATSELRLRTALQAILDGVVLCAPVRDRKGKTIDFVIDYANGATGTRLAESVARGLVGARLSRLHPELARVIMPDLVHTLSTGRPTTLEGLAVSLEPLGGAPGSARTYNISVARCAPGLLLLMRDVTDRDLAKRRLEEYAEAAQRGAQRMAAILLSATEGIYVLDGAGRCTLVNPAACAILGYEAGALIGQDIHALIHHSHSDGTPYPLETCPSWSSLTTGSSYIRQQEAYWRADGTVVEVDYSSAPIETAGSITGVVVVFQDVTERTRAYGALRESEAYLQQAQELSGIGTWTSGLGPDAEVTCSAITLGILGVPPGTVQRLHDMPALVHPDDLEMVLSQVRDAADRSSGFSLEHRIVRPDGGVRWVHQHGRLIVGDSRQPERVVGVIQDITDAKAGEARERAQTILQTGLARIAQRSLAATRLDQLGKMACDTAAALLAARYVTLSQATGGPLRLIAGHGMPADTPLEVSLDQVPIIARTLRTQRPVSVRDYRESKTGIHSFLSRLGVRSSICVPVRGGGEPWGVLVIHSTAPRVYTQDELDWLSALAGVLSVALGRIAGEDALRRSVEELRRTDKQRRALLANVVDAQEAERRRIAVEIHDDAVQAMTAVNLRLHVLGAALPESAKPNLKKLTGEVAASIARLRNLLFELAPPALDQYGLAAAMRMNAQQHLEEGNLRYRILSSLRGEPADNSRVVLYRISQEAISNVRKHAVAKTVEIEMHTTNGGTQVQIHDDGRGFAAGDLPATEPGHLGLSSMEERARMAGGWWRLSSAPGAGTTVEFWVPGVEAPGSAQDPLRNQAWDSGDSAAGADDEPG